MKSYFVSFSVIVIFFGSISVASAISQYKSFGGRITNSQKATEVEDIENSNYKCAVPGTSITIRAIGKKGIPTTYLIPANVSSKTKHRMQNNQLILGLYGQNKTSITCIFQGTPPSEQTTNLSPIQMYGTSKN